MVKMVNLRVFLITDFFNHTEGQGGRDRSEEGKGTLGARPGSTWWGESDSAGRNAKPATQPTMVAASLTAVLFQCWVWNWFSSQNHWSSCLQKAAPGSATPALSNEALLFPSEQRGGSPLAGAHADRGEPPPSIPSKASWQKLCCREMRQRNKSELGRTGGPQASDFCLGEGAWKVTTLPGPIGNPDAPVMQTLAWVHTTVMSSVTWPWAGHAPSLSAASIWKMGANGGMLAFRFPREAEPVGFFFLLIKSCISRPT